MTSISDEKKKLRLSVISKRRSLTQSERHAQSRRIASQLLTNSVFTNAKNIFFYMSLDDEVSTHDLIAESQKIKQVFLPKICNDNLVPTCFTGDTVLQKGLYGILEPDCSIVPNDSPKVDLVIVPVVAVDREGNRLGMGKGFYDRFLKSHLEIPTIALAFDFQLVDKVPTDDYDVPVSFVVTPNEFFTCKPTTSSHL